jgi:cyclopropane fatty-acyl-phospholipid synthase-like methyltransferase
MKKIDIDIESLYDKGQSDYTLYNWLLKGGNLGMHYGFWEKDTRNLFEAQQNENEYVKLKLDLRQNEKILDAGCGVGGVMAFLANRYGISVTGITISLEQVKKGRKMSEEKSLQNLLKFIKQDYHKTDFSNDSFDKIYAVESADAANPVSEFLKEMYRVLKPGGKLLIVDAFLQKSKDQFKGKDIRNLEKICNAWCLPDPNTIDYWVDEMKKIGFVDIETEELTSKVLKTSKKIYSVARLLEPIWRILYRLGFINVAHYANLVGATSQYHLFEKECLMYGSVIGSK